MKRDMDLIRHILLKAREMPINESLNDSSFNIESHSRGEIAYHVKLLHEVGLVEGAWIPLERGGCVWTIDHLSWGGHEFLETALDEAVWQKAKKISREKSGGLAFDVIKALLIQFARESVGLG